MKLLAILDGGIVIAKAWANAVQDATGWTDISEWPFVNEGENLSARILDVARTAAVSRVERGYALAMQSGFTSSALGSPHWYASDGLAMSLLIGAVAAGTDRNYECTDGNRVRALRPHTAAQLKQVLNDGAALAVQYKQRKSDKTRQINAAATVDEVKAIVW